MELFGCGRPLGADFELHMPTLAPSHPSSRHLHGDEEPEMDVHEENDQNSWEEMLLVSDEEEVDQLLEETALPVIRPFILSNSRQPGGTT